MLRIWMLLALTAALPALSQVGPVGLYTEYRYEPDAAVVQAMHQEIDKLLATGGLHFEWNSLPITDHKVWPELAVITFEGKCEVLPYASNSHADGRMGWTNITDGEVLPFATIDCEAIRALILRDLLKLAPGKREMMYGRAVGRVTAHELMHIFTRTTHHGSLGVDRAWLSRAELLADELDLEDHENPAQIVRVSKRPAVSVPAVSSQLGYDRYRQQGCPACHGDRGEGTRHGPVLRVAGRILNSVMLAAKLNKNQNKMRARARSMAVTAPALTEDDLPRLACFLSEGCR